MPCSRFGKNSPTIPATTSSPPLETAHPRGTTMVLRLQTFLGLLLLPSGEEFVFQFRATGAALV